MRDLSFASNISFKCMPKIATSSRLRMAICSVYLLLKKSALRFRDELQNTCRLNLIWSVDLSRPRRCADRWPEAVLITDLPQGTRVRPLRAAEAVLPTIDGGRSWATHRDCLSARV
jgi:hypothetical protein